MDLSAEQIINGTLSVSGERNYYNQATALFIETIAEAHDLDLTKLTKGDALRFITHIENAEPVKYSALNECNPKLFLHCRMESARLLKEGLKSISDHPQSNFQISITK